MWIIILTLILFSVVVIGIVEMKRRCVDMKESYNSSSSSSTSASSFDHPKTIASLCCPCFPSLSPKLPPRRQQHSPRKVKRNLERRRNDSFEREHNSEHDSDSDSEIAIELKSLIER